MREGGKEKKTLREKEKKEDFSLPTISDYKQWGGSAL